MSKNIQMPYEFIIAVQRLISHLDGFNLDEYTKTLTSDIEAQITAKIEQIERRELYTKSKTALTLEEREIARKKYLDKAGITKSFRY